MSPWCRDSLGEVSGAAEVAFAWGLIKPPPGVRPVWPWVSAGGEGFPQGLHPLGTVGDTHWWGLGRCWGGLSVLQNGGREGWDEKRRDSQAVCVLGVCGMLGDPQLSVPEGQ